MEELIQRQNARCAELEQKQLEAQATAENLHQDITAVKEVLHSRIRATESGLEGLELTHQRLTAELHATKTAIMDEVMIELEACFATNDQDQWTKVAKWDLYFPVQLIAAQPLALGSLASLGCQSVVFGCSL